jgi:agmatinase
MKFQCSAVVVLGSLMVGYGVVAGHQDHKHGEKQIPLHEQEYVQDPVEELERKWSFEVSPWLRFPHYL